MGYLNSEKVRNPKVQYSYADVTNVTQYKQMIPKHILNVWHVHFELIVKHLENRDRLSHH